MKFVAKWKVLQIKQKTLRNNFFSLKSKKNFVGLRKVSTFANDFNEERNGVRVIRHDNSTLTTERWVSG